MSSTKRTIDIDINSNARDTQSEFDRLRKSIQESRAEVDKMSKAFGENSKEADRARQDLSDLTIAYDTLSLGATDLNATFEDVNDGLKPLTTRLGEAEDRLYELALAGDTTSREYQDLLNAVGRYRQTQIETDRVVDEAAQTFSQKLGTALGGATSGFAVIQGSMALVGNESEALEKSLLKVQAALAIQQGVAGVLEYSRSIGLATKATRLFNTALKANPIGLVVTAVVSLIAAVGALSQAFSESAEERKTDNELALEQIETTKKQIAERLKQLKLEDRYRADRIKNLELDKEFAETEEERAEAARKIRQETLDGLEAEKKAIIENQLQAIAQNETLLVNLKKQEEEARRGGLFFSESEEVIADFAQRVIDQRKIVQRLRQQIQDEDFQGFVEIETRKREFLAKENQAEIDQEKQTNETKLQNYRDYLAARLSAQRYIEDLQFAIMEEGIEREVAINNAKFDRLIEK